MGAIAVKIGGVTNEYISIPAMGGNSDFMKDFWGFNGINPRDGGQ